MNGEEATEERPDWEPPAFSSTVLGPTASPQRNASAVLVVDDKEAVRASVADVLRTVGYTVIESGDGRDAMRLLGTMRFAAMVLDLRMPHMDGATLLRSVSRPPPTVVLSAGSLGNEVSDDVRAVVVAELKKPVSPQRLLDAVAAAVGAQPGGSEGPSVS